MMQVTTKGVSGYGIFVVLAGVYLLVNCYYYFTWYGISPGTIAYSSVPLNRRLIDWLDAKVKDEHVIHLHTLRPSQSNIFFVETSCGVKFRDPGGLVLNSKQACAIYSAAHQNPSKIVTLVYTCALLKNFYLNTSDMVNTLFDLPNFRIASLNLSEFYASSPLAPFLNGVLLESKYPVEHNADLLRILLIYNFGGTYMDLDVISLHPLDDLKTNYIGAEERMQLGTGVLNFDANNTYLKEILAQSFSAYQPEAWAAVGPVLATRVLRQACNLTDEADLRYIGFLPACNITVYGTEVFYPIPYSDWQLYYADYAWTFVEAELKKTYVVHVWNHMSGTTAKVFVGSNQPYSKLAAKYCAPVYLHSGESF